MKRLRTTRFLWITDPWDYLDHPKDTTLRLAAEAIALGDESYWADVRSIRLENGRIVLDVQRLEFPNAPSQDFLVERGAVATVLPTYFDSIQWRMDPPVDASYLHPLMLLGLGIRGSQTEVVNSLDLLFSSGEKTESFFISKRGKPLTPPSLISSEWERLVRFGTREGKTVAKPLHLCQSKGIQLLDWSNPKAVVRARAHLDWLTSGFRCPVLLQRFLPEIQKGELRVWFIDGRFLAAARKYPLMGDFRVDIDRGSRFEAARLTASERQLVTRISRYLRSRNIRLAAIDLIGRYVTDVNFTSPGLLRQLENVTGRNLARPIILALRTKSKAARAK